jgi:hypothetical protein
MADDKKITKQIPNQRTRAEFVPDSFNETDRTVELTFATETAVRTFDWDSYETIDEILVCESTSGDLTRLNSGGPVLDNHNRWGKTAEVVVGVVESARFENSTGIAKIRFGSSEDDTKLMEKVRDKIVTGVSVGYNVYEYQVTRTEGKRPQYRATKWEATEISFTPVQADVNSRVRNEEQLNNVIIEDVTPVVEAPIKEVPPNEVPPENKDAIPKENEITLEEKKEITNTNINTMTEEERLAAEAATRTQKEERSRVLGIQSKVRTLGLDEALAQTLIEEGVTLDVASTRALEAWEKKQPVNPLVPAGEHTDSEKVRSAMTNALVMRVDQRAASVMGEENVRAASDYKGMSLLRLAEESLIRSGVSTKGMSPREISKGALGAKVRGLHHTTDFPLLLMDTVNRTLLAQYAIQERTFTAWARRETMNDFRAVTRVRLSEILGNLEEVKEGAEYKYGTFSESGETYRLAKYGKIIGITWEAIINDDLSAFTRIPQAFATKAAQLQSDIVYSMLLVNGFASMSDGAALFSAAHGNFIGTPANQTAGGTVLSEANLTLAYTSFREQKGPDGSFLNLKPKFLIVGPKNEFLAQKLTSVNFTATKQSDTPVGSLTGLTLVVDARITNYAWFLAADPNQIDTVEYAFLAGEEELFIDEREGFNIDGVEVKARVVFAAKAIDWRGLYRNNGAAS